MNTDTTPAGADQRKASLAMSVSNKVASEGWRVESQSDYQAVLAKGKPTNHVLHLIITLLTFGLWLFVWPLVWVLNRRQTLILTVDEYGNILAQQ
jgi:hypothetical protein